MSGRLFYEIVFSSGVACGLPCLFQNVIFKVGGRSRHCTGALGNRGYSERGKIFEIGESKKVLRNITCN